MFLSKLFSIKKQNSDGIYRYVIKLFGIKFHIFRTKKTIKSLIKQNLILKQQIAEKIGIINNTTYQQNLIQEKLNEEIMGNFLNRNHQNIKNNDYSNIDYVNELNDVFDNISIEYNNNQGNIGFLNGVYAKKYSVYLFNNNRPIANKNKDFYAIWGVRIDDLKANIINKAKYNNDKVYIFEDGFLYNLFPMIVREREKDMDEKYCLSIGFTIDDLTHYTDSYFVSRLELMLNDKQLIITDEQKNRARKCIDFIIKNHLTKYNNQPIFEPKIGRDNVKKVLVVDQTLGDMSIIRGRANEETFKIMLDTAIKENPDADILIKTHPENIIVERKAYYSNIKEEGNIYKITYGINPISLLQYVDKVYVCTSQFGFEALMCGKEVHTFGVPFYSGWGLTIDYQQLNRRTNKRSVEEMFYIAYIMYSWYVNPEKKCKCEIEEAMDYLLKLRNEYFNSK